MNKIINKNIKQKKKTICYTKVFLFQGSFCYFHQKIVIVGSINTSHCSENEPMPSPEKRAGHLSLLVSIYTTNQIIACSNRANLAALSLAFRGHKAGLIHTYRVIISCGLFLAGFDLRCIV